MSKPHGGVLPGKTPSDDVKVMLSPGYVVWPPVAPLFMVPPAVQMQQASARPSA
ncbi:hypothetical protein PP637_gp38 [Arthrobacter phage Persistence]|uniref:Uncharacterized protein n=1 Tax=Arthrobacter phage Persistence TaxID=2836007 RepID=A0A8F3E1I0_9CAUD|nr:hypothetical protein PP637_gp38 [Arthrobacter phage Persistence]QWY79668.1 hypothetical protein SEA_PERSISTENCE_38 [Arthrobacter phage Persistence]